MYEKLTILMSFCFKIIGVYKYHHFIAKSFDKVIAEIRRRSFFCPTVYI